MKTPVATNFLISEATLVGGIYYSDPNKVPAGTEYDGLTPTIYANPSGALGNGSGSSEANAASLPNALAAAEAGDIVGILPGIATGTDTNSDVPSFQPTNSGSLGNPIILVGKFAWGSVGRTELRSGALDLGTGCPAFGVNGLDYVEWRNIYCNEENSYTRTDTGPCVLWDTTGSGIRKCRIIGISDYFPDDNHNGLRVEGGVDCYAYDNTISGFYSGPGRETNGTGLMTYGASNFAFENNEIYDCYTAIYIKGTAAGETLWNHGSIAYNLLHDIHGGMRLEAIDPSDTLTIEQNLIYEFSDFAFNLATSGGVANTRNLIMRFNSIIIGQATSNNGLYVKAITGTGNSFNDNCIAIYTTTNQNYMDGGEYTANNFTAYDYNGFYGSTNANPWSWNGANQEDITQLQAAVANSNNNQVLANDPFSGRGSGDYTITGAATTASSTGGPIGAVFADVGPR